MRPFDDDDMPVGSDEYSDVALMMAAVREWPSDEFAKDLDARVARRFAPLPPAGEALKTSHGRRWLSLPALGGAGGLVVAAVVAVFVVTQTGGNSGVSNGGPVGIGLAGHAPNARIPPRGLSNASPATSSGADKTTASAAVPKASGLPATANYSAASAGSALAVPTPAGGSGAKQIQSAQISLSVPNDHIDQVSSEVYNVVSDQHGYVGNSRITAATRNSGGGYADFTLNIPTGNLQAAMTQLSRLHYAAVSSRTDASQNVGGQYSRDQNRLHDAQALRTSLLKQLQTADSETAIDSIEAQIKTAERQITNAQTTLHSLQHRISYSTVSVDINSGGLPVIPVAKSSGFTISRGGHDAVRVLIVAAGVSLIVLAVLIPVVLVVALLGWIGLAMRQRRRERALDAG
jgi:uncharacterized protein DUF4349